MPGASTIKSLRNRLFLMGANQDRRVLNSVCSSPGKATAVKDQILINANDNDVEFAVAA